MTTLKTPLAAGLLALAFMVGAWLLPPEPEPAKAAPAPKPRAEIAAGIDYSQEVGLPVEWEEYTITGEEAARRIRQQLK